MSTKCSVLCEKGYHFYYDYKDFKYHIDYNDSEAVQSFLERTGKILENCPLSDSGIYMFSFNDKSENKVIKSICPETKRVVEEILNQIEDKFNMEHSCGCNEWCNCWKNFKEGLLKNGNNNERNDN